MTGPTPAPPSTAAASPSRNGCLAVFAIIILLALIVRCSSTSGGGDADLNESGANVMAASLSAAISSQAKAPVRAFSAASASLGAAREGIAVGREGLEGAMIYSQNCYDALSRKFTWSKLDECGAFDAKAILAADGQPAGAMGKEMTYFQSETAAGRFLSAATAAGEDAEEADRRWAQVQASRKPHVRSSSTAKRRHSFVGMTAAEQVAAGGTGSE